MKPLLFGLALFALVAIGGGAAYASSAPGGAPGDGSGDFAAADYTFALGGVTVSAQGGVMCWQTDLVLDADGAPTAYGPNGGLDYLGNAGRPGNWWGVATDGSGNPRLNAQGYYVSTTALVDPSFGAGDQRRYVDASTVPYVALGRDVLSQLGAQLGDLVVCVSRSTGLQSGAVIGDIAPTGHLHEGSIALAQALGLDGNPKSGADRGQVAYVVFPGSGAGWPNYGAADQAMQRFYAWGGVGQLNALLGG